MSKTWAFFMVAQDMVLSHHAKFQLINNFFPGKSYFYQTVRLVRLQKSFRSTGVKIWKNIAKEIKLQSTKKFYTNYKN